MSPNQQPWVVILAAGEGKRVRNLTRDRWGQPAPKQYSSIAGTKTLIRTTLERAKKIAPLERIVIVVARHHRRWWSFELDEVPPENVISQPQNRGTAAGILLPLLWIIGHDPDARLIILPSDHGVACEVTLHNAITDSASFAGHPGVGMVLLGVQPEGPEVDYGWIVPRPGCNGPFSPVDCFCEKPDAETAAVLLNRGGLLNSFILIAGARFLVNLFRTVVPQLWCSFQPVASGEWGGFQVDGYLVSLYESVPTFDFSKDVLERAVDDLWVHAVPACGWLDLGTPERLTGHLTAHYPQVWDCPATGLNPRRVLESREYTQVQAPGEARAKAATRVAM